MKRIAFLIFMAMLLLLAFSACDSSDDTDSDNSDNDNGYTEDNGNIDNDDNNGASDDGECEHTYSDKWSSSSTEHWHSATCEHYSLKIGVESHVDADQDGDCDVCSYTVGHEHEYADAWISDSTHHWHAASCLHTDAKGSLGSHVDSDLDSACDVCDTHVHVVNIFGKCAACGEFVDDSVVVDIDRAVLIAASNADRVASGSIVYSYRSGALTGESPVRTDKTIDYILGDSAAYYKIVSSSYNLGASATDGQEKWYERTGDAVFGVYRSIGGSAFVLDSAQMNALTGYYYAVSTLASAHGAENILLALYNLADDATASGFEYTIVDNACSFSFNYLAINKDTGDGDGDHVDYYEVAVSFTLSDLGALQSLSIVCDCYTNSLENEDERDYTYDPVTKTITMKDTATADTYTFTVAQTEGVRSYTSEYPKSKFIPEDFSIYSDSSLANEISGTYTVEADQLFYLYLGGCVPTGTSISYVADQFSVNCDSSDVICFSNAINAKATIRIKVAGEYTFVFKVGDIVKSITVTATPKEEEAPPAPLPSNTIRVPVTAENTSSWQTLVTFTAVSAGDYTFVIPAGVGAADPDADTPYVDPFDPLRPDDQNGGSFTVSLTAGQTYTFAINSADAGIFNIEYTVSAYTGGGVTDPEPIPEIPLTFDSSHQIECSDVILVYTADSAGVLTLSIGASIMGDVSYEYSVNGGENVGIPLSSEATIALESGDSIVITVTASGYSSIRAFWTPAS